MIMACMVTALVCTEDTEHLSLPHFCSLCSSEVLEEYTENCENPLLEFCSRVTGIQTS